MNLMNVVEQVSKVIALNDDVHAMWLEGSWATGKNNEHSDIDVWLDVKDGTFDKCIAIFRRILEDMREVDWEKSRGIYSDSPKLQKHTFHLKGFTEPQCIELDLQEHSRNFIFDHDEHVIKVLFDKDQTIRWKN